MLTDIMRARGLTDEALAAKIPSTRTSGSISATYIGRLRKGERMSSPQILDALDKALGAEDGAKVRKAAATDRTPPVVRQELARLRTERSTTDTADTDLVDAFDRARAGLSDSDRDALLTVLWAVHKHPAILDAYLGVAVAINKVTAAQA